MILVPKLIKTRVQQASSYSALIFIWISEALHYEAQHSAACVNLSDGERSAGNRRLTLAVINYQALESTVGDESFKRGSEAVNTLKQSCQQQAIVCQVTKAESLYPRQP